MIMTTVTHLPAAAKYLLFLLIGDYNTFMKTLLALIFAAVLGGFTFFVLFRKYADDCIP